MAEVTLTPIFKACHGRMCGLVHVRRLQRRGIPGDDHDHRLEYLSSAFIRHCSIHSGG